MSSSTIMKSMSEYRLSSHFGIFGAGSSEQRLSRFLPGPHDQRVSFVERNLSSHVKLVQSRRDVAPSLWGCVRMKKPLQQFCTGSRYLGEWNALGFSGDGIYRYPHGVIYEGEFNKNGLFHGLGTLLYPNGQRLQGMWKNGRLEEDQTYIFACNEVFDENFKYCQQPDRSYVPDKNFPNIISSFTQDEANMPMDEKSLVLPFCVVDNGITYQEYISNYWFHVEIQKDFGPVGQEFLTADQPTKKLRKGCYDVGLGFYDPNDGCIFSYPKKTRTSFSRRNKPVSFSVDEERIRQISEISKVMKNDKYFSYVGGKDDQFESNDGCNIFEIPTPSRVKWIEKHCRRSWDEPTGYRPDFYEKWMVGRKEDEGFRYPSSQKNVIDDSDTHPHVSKSRKQISKIKDHDRSKFMSFIQKRTSTVDGRYKNRSGAPKQELKKRVEERRAFHNRNNL